MKEKKSINQGRPVMPELLAPAGNLDKLIMAVHYGADAVYLGGSRFGLRAAAGNFSDEAMAEGVEFAHRHGCRVYVTVNVFARNQDLDGLEDYLDRLASHRVDGIIIADPGILHLARRRIPHIPIHLSTQANVTNHRAAGFWVDQGAARLNLARELSLAEIITIRKHCDAELEVFVHGALCISYSGRCLLSTYMTARDANRGECSQPCRFKYRLVEEKRPDQYFPVEEDDRGTYIFNAKDLCLLQALPHLIGAGVDSFKIEGRMRSIFYVAAVVRIYRAALDYLGSLPVSAWKEPASITVPAELLEEINMIGTRATSENFLFDEPSGDDMLYSSSRAQQQVEPVAVVRQGGACPLVEIRNRLTVGEPVEYMGRGAVLQPAVVQALQTEQGEALGAANPGSRVYLKTRPRLEGCEIHGMLRRKKPAADMHSR